MTEYQTPRLPRLLDRERVEVRLDINGTHVYEESGIDRLITHLAEAKQLFHPELSTLRSELDALSSTCTGEVKAPSYASVVRELHLTRMALNEAAAERDKYRDALVKTGCNDLFCEEVSKKCNECIAKLV